MSFFDQGNQNTQQNQRPWNYRDLRDVNNFAQYLMGQNYGFRPYNRPNYSPFAQDTLDYMDQVRSIAGSGTSMIPGASSFLNSLMSNGGMTPGMDAEMGPLRQISSGADSIGTQNWQDAYDASLGPTSSSQNLQDIASGQILRDGNPYLMDSLSRGAEQIALRSNSRAGGSGRYGSAAAAAGTAGAVGDYYARPLAAAYETGLNRMLSANQQIDSAEAERLRNQMAGAQGVSTVEGANIANRANAASSILGFMNQGANRGVQAAALAPGLDQARYADADRLRSIGQLQEAKTQQAIDQDQANWNANQNRLWQMLQTYAGIVQGTTQGGMQTNTQSPSNSWIQNVLGGASAGYGMGGFGGGLLGGLAGLFA
jgi:hypothetical protein